MSIFQGTGQRLKRLPPNSTNTLLIYLSHSHEPGCAAPNVHMRKPSFSRRKAPVRRWRWHCTIFAATELAVIVGSRKDWPSSLAGSTTQQTLFFFFINQKSFYLPQDIAPRNHCNKKLIWKQHKKTGAGWLGSMHKSRTILQHIYSKTGSTGGFFFHSR